MKRSELWMTGRTVKFAEQISCSVKGCSKIVGVREFDFGFFCWRHFMSAPECSEDGCHNPAITGVYHGVGTRCRSCEFDYDGELTVYSESKLAEAEIWADGNKGHNDVKDGLNRFIKKNGLPIRGPREWFPRSEDK